MSQMKCWKRFVVLLSVVGIGGYFSGTELTAWQDQARPQVRVRATATAVKRAATKISESAPVRLDAELEPLVLAALGDDAVKVELATRELRKHGQRAVKYVIDRTDVGDMPRWKTLADAVAAQRDSHFCGLYWHTDLAAAQAIAKRENKPILSLRLLGKLTDELSCANSRFFRTTLYPHEAVRSLLAERFVLHWESVRAVPIITIDFGDGRSIKRTITGNSLHLVLDAHGRTVDVLPGLYGAGFFARVLQQAEPLAKQAVNFDDGHFKTELAKFHQHQLDDQQRRWADDWKQLGADHVPALGHELDGAVWAKLAERYVAEVAFDGMTVAAVAAKQPAEVAGRIAFGKSITETPALRLVRNLVPVIGQDTVKNEYHLHYLIHQWMSNEQLHETQALTSRIYNELFLSPLNDPWYGLSKPDVYSAVENDGRQNAVITTQNVGHRR